MNKQRRRKRNGEASIYKRADGRWAASISIGAGKRRMIYASTEEEVIEKLKRAQNQQLDHIPFTDERLTLGSWLETWLRNVKPPATAPKTWITYEGFTRLHLIPQLGHIRLVKLTPQDVRDFMSERLDAGFSPKTVKELRGALRAALNQAVNDDILQRNVAAKVDAPELQYRTLDVYTPEEARALLKAARGHRQEALFTAALSLGLRMGECLGLHWTDIDFVRRLLTIRHNLQRVKRVRRGDVIQDGEAKTERLLGQPKGKKIKSIRLPKVVLEALQRHKANQEQERLLAGSAWIGNGEYVFCSSVGTPLEQRRVHRLFHDLCDAAGVRRIKFHGLRHSAAALLIAQGVHPKAIQELLRHASIQTTMDVYGHLLEQVQQDTADQMDAILGAEEAQKTPSTVVKTVVKARLVRVK